MKATINRSISILLILCLLLSNAPMFALRVSASESGECGEHLVWNLSAGTLTISGVGSMYWWGDAPWYESGTLTSVIICDGVTNIASDAFRGCANLTSVTIADSVTSIDSGAFYNCSNLRQVELGSGITYIGYDAFFGCTSLTNITIPASVTDISNYAFGSCSSLRQVLFAGGAPGIADDAFAGVTAKLYYPIEEKTWWEDGKRQAYSGKLTWYPLINGVPDESIVDIGYCGEKASWILKSDGVLTVSGLGYMYNWYGWLGSPWAGDSRIKEVVIEDGISNIADYAFQNCTNLQQVTMTDSVTGIDTGAFYGCTSLVSVTVGNGVSYIGGEAFYSCAALTDITIPASVTDIGSSAFAGASGLEHIYFEGKALSIAEDAFSGVQAKAYYPMEEKTWWEDGRRINYSGNLTWYPTVEGVADESIVDLGICGDNSTWILKSDGVLTVSGMGDMYNWSDSPWTGDLRITAVVIDGTVSYIGDNAFRDCTNLVRVTMSDSVTGIGSYAFHGCTGLKDVTLSSNLQNIYLEAFYGCTALTDIVIPASVTTIDSYAFGNCSGLQQVRFEGSTPWIAGDAFSGVSAKLYYPIEQTSWWADGCRVNYGGTLTWYPTVGGIADESIVDIGYCGDKATWTLTEDGVLTVSGVGNMYGWWESPWMGDSRIKEVVVSGTVSDIGSNAFRDCVSLTRVTISDAVTSIGDGAFYGCTSLTSVDLGNGVCFIGGEAFYACSALTSITLPAAITDISWNAFTYATGLEYIYFEGPAPWIAEDAFGGVTAIGCYPIAQKTWWEDGRRVNYGGSLTWYPIIDGAVDETVIDLGYCGSKVTWTLDRSGTLTISGLGDMYYYGAGSSPWYGDARVKAVVVESGVTCIGEYAFQDCTQLTSVSMADSVRYIAGYAFTGCSGLTEVSLPAGLASIGTEAFYECTSLNSIRIPAATTEIYWAAFAYCTGLKEIYFGGKAPWIAEDAFGFVVATAYYLADGDTWTSDIRNNYSGTLKWECQHSYGPWIQVKAPTCTQAGSEQRLCACGAPETREITALGHDYLASVSAPTCENQGYTTHTCNRCSDSYVDTYVAALGHSYSESVTAPTCTAQGYTTYVCSVCGKQYVDSYVNPLGHSFSGWIQIYAPDCTQAGKEQRSCSVCGLIENRELSALGHNYQTIVTAPTCTEKGFTTHTCSRCGDSYVDTYVNASGHSFGSWTQTKAPTCTVAGTEIRVCHCGHQETQVIAALGHAYQKAVTAPTCTEKGYTTYTCSHCSDSYVDSYVDALGHNYVDVITPPTAEQQGYTTHTCTLCAESYIDSYTDVIAHTFGEWVTVQAASCAAKGHEERTCSVCGKKESRDIPALGHSYTAAVTAPTCTEKGFTTHTCSRCGDSYTDTYTNALDHSFGDWAQAKAPSCTAEGTEIRTCHCGHEESRVLAALGHTYQTSVTAPTCTEKGFTTHTCSQCSDSYADAYTDALGHDYESTVTPPTAEEMGYTTHICKLCAHSYKDSYTDPVGHVSKWEGRKEATCTEDGYTGDSICADCGKLLEKGSVIPALGHSFGEWVPEKAPACEEEGREYRSCASCNHTETRNLAALGHSYQATVVAPTCTENGYTSHTCAQCGSNYVDAHTDALGHIWLDATATAPKTCQICGATEGSALDPSKETCYQLTSESGNAGDLVEIYMSVSGNPGLITLRSSISYDETALELVKAEDTGLLSGWTVPAQNISSPYILRWADALAVQNNTANGKIVKLTFRILENAPLGEYKVTVTHVEARDKDGKELSFASGIGIITVTELVPGDADGDGVVSDWDAVVMERYLAGWDVELKSRAVDLDGDGEISDWDAILLTRYLAGWDIEI